jgi:hypothetical protein
MRTLILLGLVVGGLVVAGAIHISQSGDTLEISVDRQKAEAVADRVIHEGETILKSAAAESAARKW